MQNRPARASVLPALLLVLAGSAFLRCFHVAAPAAAQMASGPSSAPFDPFASGLSSTLRPARPAERKAAIAAIVAQLAAFKRDDYAAAVQYQSAGLRRTFPGVRAFRQMMQTVYPEFAHYRSAQFGAAQAEPSGLHVVVPVTLMGQNGYIVQAAYVMVREGKAYRVEGVQGGQRPPLPDARGADV